MVTIPFINSNLSACARVSFHCNQGHSLALWNTSKNESVRNWQYTFPGFMPRSRSSESEGWSRCPFEESPLTTGQYLPCAQCLDSHVYILGHKYPHCYRTNKGEKKNKKDRVVYIVRLQGKSTLSNKVLGKKNISVCSRI